jgi:hypothetical protein
MRGFQVARLAAVRLALWNPLSGLLNAVVHTS